MQTLSPHQVQRLFDLTKDDRLHALWMLLITSGLRIGEVTPLTWEDVDLDRVSVSVRCTIQRLKGRGLVMGEPKTARSRRTVYLPSSTIAALHFHKDRQKSERKMAQNLRQNRDLVFCTAVGGPIDSSTVNPLSTDA